MEFQNESLSIPELKKGNAVNGQSLRHVGEVSITRCGSAWLSLMGYQAEAKPDAKAEAKVKVETKPAKEAAPQSEAKPSKTSSAEADKKPEVKPEAGPWHTPS